MDEIQYKCSFCFSIFINKEDKKNHELYCYLRDDNIPSTSKGVDLIGERIQSCESDLNSDLVEGEIKCSHCDSTFDNIQNLINHVEQEVPHREVCEDNLTLAIKHYILCFYFT